MIKKARSQLVRKSPPNHSRNVFLISHLLDHPYVEVMEPVVAHALDPLSDIEDLETVWLLWAPLHLVVWSTANQTWTTSSSTPPTRG
jgi:hypothetical protein